MWKPEHRLAADRRGLRYPSDLTDAEWAIVAAMIPPGRHGGRRRSVNVREVLNGIFYVLWTGCQWLPKRWIVERTFAWISRNRRLARDFERYATTVAAFIRLAMIRIMLRRLAANASL